MGLLFNELREKGRDLTQSCDKNPYTNRTIQKTTWQHKNATKNFDYTTIADRLRFKLVGLLSHDWVISLPFSLQTHSRNVHCVRTQVHPEFKSHCVIEGVQSLKRTIEGYVKGRLFDSERGVERGLSNICFDRLFIFSMSSARKTILRLTKARPEYLFSPAKKKNENANKKKKKLS